MLVKLESRQEDASTKDLMFFHSLTSKEDTGGPLLSQDSSHFVLIFSRWLAELGLSSWLLQGNVSRESVRNVLLAH